MKRTYWRSSFEFCFLYLAIYPGNHLAVHSDGTYFLYSCTVLHCVDMPRFIHTFSYVWGNVHTALLLIAKFPIQKICSGVHS